MKQIKNSNLSPSVGEMPKAEAVMKKLKLLLFFLLLPTGYVHAQWEVQLDNQNLTHLDRIFFLNENYGWAIGGATIGDLGPYFYTTDGGLNWYLYDWQLQGTDIVFVNPDTGFIAAPNGIIRKTVNGGQTWSDIQTPATQDVMHLFFVDENNGWATLGQYSEGNILHTEDGGNTWELQQVIVESNGRIFSIFFLNDSTGWGGGTYNDGNHHTVIKYTEDSGETWNTIYSEIYQYFSIFDIFFLNSQIGWVVGWISYTPYILKTIDGGENWQQQTIANETIPAHCVYFINDTIGWIGIGDAMSQDDYGAIYFTVDSGENWQLQQEFNFAILDIQMLNQDTGWAVGGDFIYYTTNGDTVITTNIKEKQATDFNIIINPNPTYGVFTINLPNEISNEKIIISDITGKEIINTQSLKHNSIIDISEQLQGIYFLTIEFELNRPPLHYGPAGNQIYSLTKKIIKL